MSMRKWWTHSPVILGQRNEWGNCVTMFTSIVSAASAQRDVSSFTPSHLDYVTPRRAVMQHGLRSHLSSPTRP